MLADTFLLSTYRASGTLGIPYRTLEREGLTLLSWVEFTPNRMPAGFRGIAILRSELLAFQSPAGAHWFAGIFPSNYRQHTASGAGVRFARARIGDESWQATVQDTPVQAGVNHTVLLFRRGSFVVWLTVWSVRSSSVSAARSYGALLDRRVQQGF
jgi:hypothetical protein